MNRLGVESGRRRHGGARPSAGCPAELRPCRRALTAAAAYLLPCGGASAPDGMIDDFSRAGLGREPREVRRGRGRRNSPGSPAGCGAGPRANTIVMRTQPLLSVSRCPKRSTIAPEGVVVGADAQYCLRAYYGELQERFDGGFDPELSLVASVDEFAPPRGTFLLVRLNGEPVGCGGLKPISRQAAYLKRMWIAPAARGQGLARLLLSALEESTPDRWAIPSCGWRRTSR